MKNRFLLSPLFLVIVLFSLAGCSTYSIVTDPIADFIGTGLSDLQKARDKGLTRDYPIPYDEAFDRTVKTLKDDGFVSYQSDKKKGYIVFMGLPKQVNTTRVGVFFESIDANNTRITVSSLSSTALAKAGSIVFGGLETR